MNENPLFTSKEAFEAVINFHISEQLKQIKLAAETGELTIRFSDLTKTQVELLKKLKYDLIEYNRQFNPLRISIEIFFISKNHILK